MNLLITIKATINETIKPTAREIISGDVRIDNPPIFKIFKKLIPTITGIAKKNENSAAATVESPDTQPPIIVEAERDIPGIIAKH